MKKKTHSSPNLRERLVLLAGSAATNAPSDKLSRAHDFVRLLTCNVVEDGGGLVVFAGGEPKSDEGTPLVFDWTALRAIAATSSPSISPTVVITSEKVRTLKMTDEHRQLLAILSARGLIELVSIPDEVHTGGNIGDEQVGRADAMIAIGGGKGVADRARKMCKLGRPVLPMDISIGAGSNDGDGALKLHRDLMADPKLLFPATGEAVRSRMLGMSLDAPVLELGELARRVADTIAQELGALELQFPRVLVLTALPVELDAAREAFGGNLASPRSTPAQTSYWPFKSECGTVVAIACFGNSGNLDAAASTTELLDHLSPSLVVMVGIAAGIRDKCRLGEVVISERVVAYEGAALTTGPDGSQVLPRPEQYRPPHGVLQAISAYVSDVRSVSSRLARAARAVGLVLPPDSEFGAVTSEFVPRLATLAAGEKLLRDPDKFRAFRSLHGKVEVAEMEAAGVANACQRRGVPYVIIRGISDFGDDKKDDRFHRIAAAAASIVAADFIRHEGRGLAHLDR